KAVAVNVSDIAAMGATPHSILLALALPEHLANEQWLTEFAKGLFHACQLFGITLIGGDTTRSDRLVLSVSAQGLLAANIPAVYRSGAQVGDKIYVSGSLGDAAYALQHPTTAIGIELAHRLHMPTPRIALGAAVATIGATSMIDISDGLYQDLSHICEQSIIGMRIHLEQLPTSKALSSVGLSERLLCQLAGGDDYELAFTLPAHIEPPINNNSDTHVTCIGEVIAVNKTDGAKNVQPEIFYQGQPVTATHPAPFPTWPNLTGYQHFAGYPLIYHIISKPIISQANDCPPLPADASALDRLVYWLGIGLGSGLPRRAPGTWGTVGGLIVAIPLLSLGFVPF